MSEESFETYHDHLIELSLGDLVEELVRLLLSPPAPDQLKVAMTHTRKVQMVKEHLDLREARYKGSNARPAKTIVKSHKVRNLGGFQGLTKKDI